MQHRHAVITSSQGWIVHLYYVALEGDVGAIQWGRRDRCQRNGVRFCARPFNLRLLQVGPHFEIVVATAYNTALNALSQIVVMPEAMPWHGELEASRLLRFAMVLPTYIIRSCVAHAFFAPLFWHFPSYRLRQCISDGMNVGIQSQGFLGPSEPCARTKRRRAYAVLVCSSPA